jgi:flagellar FliL protein
LLYTQPINFVLEHSCRLAAIGLSAANSVLGMASEEADTTTDESSAPEATSGGGGSKLVLILTAVNLLISLGVAGVVFISFKKEAHQPRVTDIVANEAPTENKKEGQNSEGGASAKASTAAELGKVFKVELAMFTVNLQSPGSVNPRFARVNVTVEVTSEETEKEVNQKMAQVRNTVIDLINSKTPADVKEIEGKNHLKEQIQKALNAFLVTGKVKGVYFTSFVINS